MNHHDEVIKYFSILHLRYGYLNNNLPVRGLS